MEGIILVKVRVFLSVGSPTHKWRLAFMLGCRPRGALFPNECQSRFFGTEECSPRRKAKSPHSRTP